jgi:nucleotide-binding universal stress UspA family protein
MYKKILVPLDGSKFAECVLNHVKSVAEGCCVSEVILLFVVESVKGVWNVPENWVGESLKQSTLSAETYLKEISSDLIQRGIPVTSKVLQGPPAETILSYAQANAVELIITSTHGRSGIKRWVFGSVADKVIHQSLIPVLIVTPPGCRQSISE